MICEHSLNNQGNRCFIPDNAWSQPCNDCPCPNKVEEYLKTPEARKIFTRSKALLDRIAKEQQSDTN